jgi:tight adherence protein B
MKFYRELVEAAGLSEKRKELGVGLALVVLLSFLILTLFTGIPALAGCVALLVLAAALEVIRVIAGARAQKFEALWPQVFDSFQNAAQSSISLLEQLEYVSQSGPIRLRPHFAKLRYELERGDEPQLALGAFRSAIGSRHADFLALLIELSSELGSNSMSKTWESAASELRSEHALFGQVLAKQGWVLGSAKISLIAPWLIAVVLIQLEQNRNAFASELGALVLILGLLLSALAYFLVNRLAKLTLPRRIFYATS